MTIKQWLREYYTLAMSLKDGLEMQFAATVVDFYEI